MNTQELLAHVEAVIDKLEDQLADDDKRCGWTERHRTITKALFESLRKDVMEVEFASAIEDFLNSPDTAIEWPREHPSLGCVIHCQKEEP